MKYILVTCLLLLSSFASSQTIKREDYASYTEYANAVAAFNRAQKSLPAEGRQSSGSADFIALGCEPYSGNIVLPTGTSDYRKAPRARYIFMHRKSDGDITRLCIDEIGTEAAEALTCATGVKITSNPNFAMIYDFAGFDSLKVMRADATMYTEHSEGSAEKVYQYACAPSQNAGKVLGFVNDEKRKQKSRNVF